MRNVFIINPAAGTHDCTNDVKKLIEKNFDPLGIKYEIYISEYPKHPTKIVKDILENTDEFITFYSVGGDGTLNEIVNGVSGYSNQRICIVPCGSGNDLIKTVMSRVPDIESSLKISDDNDLECDIIRSEGRVSLNICSAGIDAVVALNADKIKRFPLCGGSISYLLAIIYTLITNSSFKFSVTIDDKQTIEGKFMMIVAANGKYYGGGIKAVPEAQIDDGLLDFLIVKAVSKFKIIPILIKYMNGKHNEIDQKIIEYIRGKKLRVKSDEPVAVNFDGEVEMRTDSVFEIEKGKIRLATIIG